MRKGSLISATAAVAATVAAGGTAQAGGFEVHEQSAHYQGMSFAGSAAGGSLSSMFWNPAAAGMVGKGLSFESSWSWILPDSEVTATGGTSLALVPASSPRSTDIARDAVVPASYAAWRSEIDPNLVLAVSINSQFGLGTKPDNVNWAGQYLQRSSKLMSVNVAPTMAYQLMPGVQVAGGLQFQHFDLKHFKAEASPLNGPNGNSSSLEGSDFGIGFTAGIIVTPAKGTVIGVGYRSQIDHDLKGNIILEGTPFSSPIHADVTTPDKITASIEQAISPTMRLNATVEWTNWSLLGVHPVVLDSNGILPATGLGNGATASVLDFQWHDGWFFALGGEYDYSNKLTLRAGGAYEISPIQNASERLIQVPDADRIWASLGATYKWSETISVDFAYSHIFVEDASFARVPASVPLANAGINLRGDVESSVDIISVGLKSKW